MYIFLGVKANGVPAQVRRAGEHLGHDLEARQVKGHAPSPYTVTSTTDVNIADGDEDAGVLDSLWSGLGTLAGSPEDEGTVAINNHI